MNEARISEIVGKVVKNKKPVKPIDMNLISGTSFEALMARNRQALEELKSLKKTRIS